MTIETLKTNFIEQVKQIRSKETLMRLQEILESSEMMDRTKESLEDIENGNVISLANFDKQNKEWIKTQFIN